MNKQYKRLVVKLGTSVLTNGTPRLYRPQIVELVRQCALLHQAGVEVIICTSGAIAAGREHLDFPDLPRTVTNKQMWAAVGQSRLMLVWARLFEIYDIRVGQMLLTRADVEDRRRYLNARDTLNTLLAHQIIPIINENDAVATEEIKVGDNDNLSALVATLAEADALFLLTDTDGLYTADPRTEPKAQLIRHVTAITANLKALAGDSVSGLGTGGMATKVQAAEVATRMGTDVVIAAGREPNVIFRLAQGEAIGTKFSGIDTPPEQRKRWILAGSKPVGSLVIDEGAERALVQNGRSLLPAGITHVQGAFGRGDTISITNKANTELARGIARYNSRDMAQIAGYQSEKIQPTLGYEYGPVAVHRNDLILL